MVVVGLHPNCDIQALQRQYVARKSEGSGRVRTALNNSQSQSRVEPHLEPQVGLNLFYKSIRPSCLRCLSYEFFIPCQVLFVYPPEKQLPCKYKDLLSFCFPGGVEVGFLLNLFLCIMHILKNRLVHCFTIIYHLVH